LQNKTKMKRYFWSEKWKYVIAILSVLKCWLLLQNVIYPKPRIEQVNLSHKLENIYNLSSETFSILDLKNISFTLRPRGSCEKTTIVLMVLSAPKNIQKREKLREQFRKAIYYQIQYHKSRVIVVTKLFYFFPKSDSPHVKLVFLLGHPKNPSLESENLVHGDLVQANVKDHYMSLHYKTLSGFVWVNRFCGNTRYVVKIDDDVKLDMENLEKTLSRKYRDEVVPDILECPSVLRNVRPFQHNSTRNDTIMTKWTVHVDRRVFPDYCIGWMYMMTPRVALALTEVSVLKHKDLVVTNDDNFITGFLREHIPSVTINQLGDNVGATMWNNVFSTCPFLSWTKIVFGNDFVMEKGSDGIQYVNGRRFYTCSLLEYFIYDLETMFPSARDFTQPFWNYCSRGKRDLKKLETEVFFNSYFNNDHVTLR